MRASLALVLALTLLPLHADDELDGPLERTDGTRIEVTVPSVVRRGEVFEIAVRFRIPAGYHIYGPVADGVANPQPTMLECEPVPGLLFGEPQFPPVHKGPFKDPILEVTLTEYEGEVVVVIPVEVERDAALEPRAIKLKAAWGTCNDQSCREIRSLTRNPGTFSRSTRVVLARPSVTTPKTELAPGETFALTVELDVPARYYVYGPEANDRATPTCVAPGAVDGIVWEAPSYPAATAVDGHTEYRGKVAISIAGRVLADAKPGPRRIVVLATWGTCDARSCYEFVKQHPLAVTVVIKAP